MSFVVQERHVDKLSFNHLFNCVPKVVRVHFFNNIRSVAGVSQTFHSIFLFYFLSQMGQSQIWQLFTILIYTFFFVLWPMLLKQLFHSFCSDFPCSYDGQEDSWGEILSVYRTCDLELSSSMFKHSSSHAYFKSKLKTYLFSSAY